MGVAIQLDEAGGERGRHRATVQIRKKKAKRRRQALVKYRMKKETEKVKSKERG